MKIKGAKAQANAWGKISLGLLAVSVAAPVAAQEDTSAPGDIIVTAQKREQRLQDVPVVVTALSGEALQNAGVKDIKDLQTLTPGLTVTSTTSETSTTARIRGVGTVGDNPGLESSVGVVIDGVYRPRNGVSFGDIGDMERIEVLKGPQGTLFGKNTSAGVINVLTAAPTFKPSMGVELTGGNHGQYGGSLSLNGPLIEDKLAARLYIAGRQRDGFYDVRTGAGPRTLEEDQDQKFFTIRGQTLFTPNDRLEFRLIGDYTKRDENCCAAVQTRTGPSGAIVNAFAGGAGLATTADPFERVAYANRDNTQKITDKGLSLEGTYSLPGLNGALTSITAFRNWKADTGLDADFSTADIWYRDVDLNSQEFDTFSQELRLAGATDKLDWMVGGYYAHEDLTRRDSLTFGTAYEPYFSTALINNLSALSQSFGGPALSTANGFNFVNEMNPATATVGGSFVPGQGHRDRYEQTSKSLAFFTNNTYRATDKLDLTLGLRYTSDKKDVDSTYAGNTITGCAGLTPTSVGTALVGRGLPFGALATPLGAALVQTAIGGSCLARWNPGFNGQTFTQDDSSEEWSGTFKASYKWNPDFMTYASYARGYKSGGYNLDRTTSSNGLQSGAPGIVPVVDTSFPGEFVDSYELGAKTQWFDGALAVNATAFYQKYEDFQLNTFVGTEFIVDSIPEVTSKGVDLDVFWRLRDLGLSFQAGATYADTQVEDFTAADLANPARFPALSLLPGQTLGFAPEWSLSGAVTYERDVFENFRFLASLNGKYQSSYNTGSDLSPFKKQDGFAVFNGRIGIGSKDERWTLEGWAQNLFDEDYYQVVFAAPLQGQFIPTGSTTYSPATDSNTYNAFLGAPRTIGATLRLKFQ